MRPALTSPCRARNISKTYGEVEALRDLSLEFPERDSSPRCWGRRAAARPRLLKIIAGLLEPNSGEIEVNGKPVTGPGPDRAFVFQDFALLPWASVIRNVAFGLGAARRGQIGARGQGPQIYPGCRPDGVSKTAIPTNSPAACASGSGLARALSVDAEVLLMDEPFSAVDEQTRRKFQEDLLNLVQNENKTFIFVTHSIEEAVYVSDQIAILLPRPSRVSEIIRPTGFRDKGTDNIRRDPEYLDIVDRIWASLRSYVE